jgi:hypothetical protein
MPTITFAHLDSAMRIVREPAEPPASEVIPIEQPPPALSAGAHRGDRAYEVVAREARRHGISGSRGPSGHRARPTGMLPPAFR